MSCAPCPKRARYTAPPPSLSSCRWAAWAHDSPISDPGEITPAYVPTQTQSVDSPPERITVDSIDEEFTILNKVGEGTYGVVYRARRRSTGQIVALKKVKTSTATADDSEVEILSSLNPHPSIIRLEQAAVSARGAVFTVMEYVEHEIRALLAGTMRQPFSQSEAKCLMLQILLGLNHLHQNRVFHRDLKTSNLLYNNRGELKICDFGLACRAHGPVPHTQPVVTLWYRAPELLLGARSYSTAIDMWSAGCIMAELLLGKPLFEGNTEIDQLAKIYSVLGTPDNRIWPGFSELPGNGPNKVRFIVGRRQNNSLRQLFPKMSFIGSPTLSDAGLDLLKGLLTYDPKRRMKAGEALAHRWFREVPLPKDKDFMPTFPPKHCLKVFRTNEKELVMELTIQWAGNPNIVVAVTISPVQVTVQLFDVQVFAAPRISLKLLVPTIPCFANIIVSLMEKEKSVLLAGALFLCPLNLINYARKEMSWSRRLELERRITLLSGDSASFEASGQVEDAAQNRSSAPVGCADKAAIKAMLVNQVARLHCESGCACIFGRDIVGVHQPHFEFVRRPRGLKIDKLLPGGPLVAGEDGKGVYCPVISIFGVESSIRGLHDDVEESRGELRGVGSRAPIDWE
ncbi:protein kinase-like protein [Striga asiatica]|uniref:Protein kinase-like protein n=1 Tax=Striga asiatica TaxID=4170 RepID=A0A5A7QUT6_STRAF|nr:protein kinase-like protein [Striga asiatica]